METTALRAGSRVHGFEIESVMPLEELKAIGIKARHLRTGTELFHILNDDSENLFAFAFATATPGSTGVAHILEHSVLCGSERHPLKDAFLVLAQGSLQTFLNAMTYPDKTVYPASSTNERDYFNLMGVYGDAVFRPLLSEWTFLQEGHRLELDGNGTPSISGVVYNEMKGAYSSMDAIASDWTYRALFPDTAYAWDSGGDPDEIPKLTWEALKDFHRTHYNPANCRVFLCGNIPTEQQLAFLDERFFSVLEPGSPVPALDLVERWTSRQSFAVPYPATPGAKSTVFLSWLCGDSRDPDETLALAALAEILLGHDGSPLARALVDSHLGEDLTPVSGLEGELRETAFAVGLRGVQASDAHTIEKLIIDTLSALVEKGISAEDIEAAMASLEFANREVRRSGGPFSLSWLRRSLRGWLHGAEPWTTLLFTPSLEALKSAIAADGRYFEGLIQRYFIDNPHRALVTIEPDETMSARKDAELAASLSRRVEGMSGDEIRAIREKSARLLEVQSEADSPEALATIPHLSRADLSAEVEHIDRHLHDAKGVPAVSHELFTNGVSYVDLAFAVDQLCAEDYLYLPLLSRVLGSMGLPGLDYGEVSSLVARTMGGFYAVLQTSSPVPGAAKAVATPTGILDLAGRDWIVFRLKALDEKLSASLELALRLVTRTDFSDLKRLETLVLELRNDLDSSLAPNGHAYASGRAGRLFSRSRLVDEAWGGLSQIEFSQTLAKSDVREIARRLDAILARMLSGGLLVNITASASSIDQALASVGEHWARFGSPRPRISGIDQVEALRNLTGGDGRNEVVSSSGLQVGFAALSLPAAPFATREQAAEIVLAHRLSTGSLWETIRMKGGAYGGFASPDGLEGLFSFASYRDPDPSRSLEAFRDALAASAREQVEDEELEKTIIGAYSKETRPRAPVDSGFADFMRLLYGITDEARSGKLAAMIALTSGELAASAARLHRAAATAGATGAAVLSGDGVAEKAAKSLGAVVRRLS